MEEAPIKIDVLTGTCKCRSWLEAEMMPDGNLRLVGMGSITSFDRDGAITSYKCEPTGIVMYWPPLDNKPVPWWVRIFA